VCLIRVGDELCRTVDRQEQDWAPLDHPKGRIRWLLVVVRFILIYFLIFIFFLLSSVYEI